VPEQNLISLLAQVEKGAIVAQNAISGKRDLTRDARRAVYAPELFEGSMMTELSFTAFDARKLTTC